MANPKFLAQVGSQSRLPPVIIEGGIRYVAETPEKLKSIVLENGDSVEILPGAVIEWAEPNGGEPKAKSIRYSSTRDINANYFAGGYAEDEPAPPKPPEPPHELDVIQRLSEACRAEGLKI